jgi:hypothetical protein
MIILSFLTQKSLLIVLGNRVVPYDGKGRSKTGLLGGGGTYYDDVYCYYCVNKKNYRNYMFSPDDAENQKKEYKRLRMGVLKFSQIQSRGGF